jgi:CRISPR-associated protein Cas1
MVMKQHLNTLFVTTQGTYLRKAGDTVVVRVEERDVLRVPFNNLGSIACFGRVSCSPFLFGACGQRGIGIAFLTEQGRFMAAVNGYTPGNILLRRTQYRAADDLQQSSDIARSFVIGKLANYRTILRRVGREQADPAAVSDVSRVADRIDQSLHQLDRPCGLDQLRGIEGENSASYFSVFNHQLMAQKEAFEFRGRSRRPPLDPMNALLSFLYALLTQDARSACEAAGLDAAAGFLHRDRPGRPGLALDLMEELRPILADRLAVSLVNRQQVRPGGFTREPAGGWRMDDATRKTVISAYQKRKQQVIHPFLDEKITLGLVVHIQARLLARYLRGDLNSYPAFVWR